MLTSELQVGDHVVVKPGLDGCPPMASSWRGGPRSYQRFDR